jgi:hypothetical protein
MTGEKAAVKAMAVHYLVPYDVSYPRRTVLSVNAGESKVAVNLHEPDVVSAKSVGFSQYKAFLTKTVLPG